MIIKEGEDVVLEPSVAGRRARRSWRKRKTEKAEMSCQKLLLLVKGQGGADDQRRRQRCRVESFCCWPEGKEVLMIIDDGEDVAASLWCWPNGKELLMINGVSEDVVSKPFVAGRRARRS